MRVLVYDPNPLTREGLALLLQSRGAEVLEATCAEEAQALAIGKIDVALVTDQGWSTVLGDERRSAPVLVLASGADYRAVLGCIQAGAAGFLLASDVDPDDLYRALEVAVSGQGTVLASGVIEVLYRHIRFDPNLGTVVDALRGLSHHVLSMDPVARAGLTPREGQVLECIGEGMSTPEIARYLCTSPSTAKNHLSNIYRKLGVRNRFAAARVAGQLFPNGSGGSEEACSGSPTVGAST